MRKGEEMAIEEKRSRLPGIDPSWYPILLRKVEEMFPEDFSQAIEMAVSEKADTLMAGPIPGQ